jgi:5-methylcytosine-specific restriction endonuclease McrA
MPINRINLKRAVILLLTGKAEPIDFIGDVEEIPVHASNFVLLVPPHIRLTVAHQERRGWKIPAVTRREVLRRDRHTCQYCGSTRQLTIDHVIPRSKGGKHTWDNVVAACDRCNSHKGDRLPQQAGMVLRSQPKTPMHPAVMFAEEFWREQQQAKADKITATASDNEMASMVTE